MQTETQKLFRIGSQVYIKNPEFIFDNTYIIHDKVNDEIFKAKVVNHYGETLTFKNDNDSRFKRHIKDLTLFEMNYETLSIINEPIVDKFRKIRSRVTLSQDDADPKREHAPFIFVRIADGYVFEGWVINVSNDSVTVDVKGNMTPVVVPLAEVDVYQPNAPLIKLLTSVL